MKYKRLIIAIAIPLLVGFLGNILGNASMGFDSINKPSFTPPGIVFPIVWGVLYILMGISSYLVYKSSNKSPLVIYGVQLFFNMVWPLFFFNLGWYFFSFIWLIILLILVIVMVYKFYKTNKTAGLLQIPYLLWLIFASVLNFGVFLMN